VKTGNSESRSFAARCFEENPFTRLSRDRGIATLSPKEGEGCPSAGSER